MPTTKLGWGLARLFRPSTFSLVLASLAVVWLVLIGGCSAALFSGSGLFGAASGVVIVPVGALFCFVAAIFAGGPTAKSFLFGSTTFILALGAMLIVVDDLDSQNTVGAVIISILLYSIPLVVSAGLSVFFGMRGVKEMAEQIEELRADYLCEVLLSRGEASFQTLSEASGVPETQVDDVIDARVASGRLAAVLDNASHMAFTAACFQAKEAELAAAVYQRGRAAIYDIAKSLRLSEQRFKELLYAAIAHGRFEGYVDWRRGIVFSVDGKKLREGRGCPSCGGSMSLAGRGAVACNYCGAEVLLA